MSEEDRKAACVIGWPIAHSRSPLIHNYWIKQHKLERRIPARGGAAGRDSRSSSRTCARTAMSAPMSRCRTRRRRSPLSTPDDRAKAVGAANTLYYVERHAALDQQRRRGLPRQSRRRHAGRGSRARHLGGARRRRGGARRAFSRSPRVRVSPRLCHQPHARPAADALAAALRWGASVGGRSPGRIVTGCWGEAAPFSSTRRRSAGPIGRRSSSSSWRSPPWPVAADIVYAPLETPRWRAARARGNCLRNLGGLGMLLHQARPGFELWFGVKPEVTPELRALVEADLTKHLPKRRPRRRRRPPAEPAAREGAQAQEKEAAGEIAPSARSARVRAVPE